MIHLHVHSRFSPLDGLSSPEDLAIKSGGVMALTDHDSLGGLPGAKSAVTEKLISGMEVTLCDGSHLVLLAKNEQGFESLKAIVSRETRPDIGDIDGRGLVALTGCVRGRVPAAILEHSDPSPAVHELVSVFGVGNVWIELQATSAPHTDINGELLELAKSTGLGAVVTADVHYVEAGEWETQNTLMAIRQQNKKGKTFRHEAGAYAMKSEDEVRSVLTESGIVDADIDVLIAATHYIADMCDDVIEFRDPELPTFSKNEESDLRLRAADGMKERGLDGDDVYLARLEHELGVITSMGFSGYFLIVWDFISYARRIGVPVGPGRGSGAGSLVAYCLEITDIDPIANDLFFERFLNPDRVSMPDFDIDFSQAGRHLVIEYVVEKYGREHVAQIATYMTMSPKSAIKDVGRVMGLPFDRLNDLTSQIPDTIRAMTEEEESMSKFELAMTRAGRLKAEMKKDSELLYVVNVAEKLMGCVRQTGTHAAGVVIGRQPISHYCPVSSKGLALFDKDDVEKVGLVKFDFLGLKTLDVIDIASRAAGVDIRGIGHGDGNDEVYASMSGGLTWGLFQIESPGMSALCQNIDVSDFGGATAAVALYRPGPKESGMVDDYVACARGNRDVVYAHPRLEPVLKDTYGSMVYQEQVMQVARVIAGYSMAEADTLRRVMGKKKVKAMAAERKKFVAGCRMEGHDETMATMLFNSIEKFAGYGFNKSHAAAYARITFETAWLRYHYLDQFVAALLTVEEGKPIYVRSARRAGIDILPPDIARSGVGFSVVSAGVVRWGLEAIKGVGHDMAMAIVDARGDGNSSLEMMLAGAGSGVVKALAASGALDAFGDRQTMISGGTALARASRKLGGTGQSFFGFCVLPDATDAMERGRMEYKYLGSSLSFEPALALKTIGNDLTVVGQIEKVNIMHGKKGVWARVTISGWSRDYEIAFFGRQYADCEDRLVEGNVVAVSVSGTGDRLSANRILEHMTWT